MRLSRAAWWFWFALLAATCVRAADELIVRHAWSPEIFARAKRVNKFVLLDQ